jgi:hypothetical protein
MRWCFPFLPLFAPLGLCACAGAPGGDTGGTGLFCESMSTADQWKIEGGGGTSVSGVIYGRLLTDKSEDPRDPNFVAYVGYAMKSLDVGGVQTPGETDVKGDFVETVGAGQWEITVAAVKNGWTCNNQVSFEVEAGSTTWLCLDLRCE